MRRINYLPIVFFLLDLFIFLYFKQISLEFKSLFWISHFGLSIIYIYINNLYLQGKQYDIFILIFPIIGYFMLLISQFIKYNQNDIKIDVNLKKYIQEKKNFDKSIYLNCMGAYDILATGTSEEKKNFLIEFKTKDLKFKIQVLKKMLIDKDIEVVHYAAIELNKIDDIFQSVIKEKIKMNDIRNLCEIYFDYCSSGLLVGEILEFYQYKCIELLKSKKEYVLKDKYKLFCLYNSMGKDCEIIIKDILGTKEIENEILESIKNYYYNLNNFEKLKEVEQWQKFV
ncbi:MAG: hypothetical protein MJH09_06510 [Cetobacterium sp.]|nr:hypothetical protein [Cetobacterium sp.]